MVRVDDMFSVVVAKQGFLHTSSSALCSLLAETAVEREKIILFSYSPCSLIV